MTIILHITSRDAWLAAQQEGTYRGDTLESEGFIHCSRPEQVAAVANAYFPGRRGLVLLCIETEKVQNEIRYEDLYNAGQVYPHLYGPLNLDAVRSVVDFPPQTDGSFVLPEAAQ